MTRLNTWSTAAEWSQWNQGQGCNFTTYDCYWCCVTQKASSLFTNAFLKKTFTKNKDVVINISVLTQAHITGLVRKVLPVENKTLQNLSSVQRSIVSVDSVCWFCNTTVNSHRWTFSDPPDTVFQLKSFNVQSLWTPFIFFIFFYHLLPENLYLSLIFFWNVCTYSALTKSFSHVLPCSMM